MLLLCACIGCLAVLLGGCYAYLRHRQRRESGLSFDGMTTIIPTRTPESRRALQAAGGRTPWVCDVCNIVFGSAQVM